MFEKFPSMFTAHRFAGVLLLQVVLLLAAGFSGGSAFREEIVLLALVFMLMGSGLAILRASQHVWSFAALALITLVANIIGYISPLPEADLLASMLTLVFMVWVMLAMAWRVFLSPRNDENVVLGAACLYVHVGMMFGFVYVLVDYFVPHSFSMATPIGAPDELGRLLGHFMYYSLVTLGTVGYGDIAPVSAPARYISVIEAIAGQLYLAILVARLVGLHLNEKNTPSS